MSTSPSLSGAASAYVRDRITNLKVGMFLETFTILGAMVGASITVTSAPRPLFFIFGLVLLASWFTLFLQRHAGWRPVVQQDAFSHWLQLEGSYYDRAAHETVDYHGGRAYFGGPLMFGAGLIAGLLWASARGRSKCLSSIW